MSPAREIVVAQQDQVRIRHIGPKAAVWPDAPGGVPEYAVLSRDDMVARALPISNVPASPDFVSGSWTGRLDDAGEATVVFPNGMAPDGVPWRNRFDTTGHLQWLEIYFNGELDFVGVIDQVTVDEASVTVHCDDAFYVLKKAYVRDWIVTQAPRDVIERGTQVWTPTTVDNFPSGTLNSQWTVSTQGSGTVALQPSSGGCLLSIPASSILQSAAIDGPAVTVESTGTWSTLVSLGYQNLADSTVTFTVLESGGNSAALILQALAGSVLATFEINANTMGSLTVGSALTYTVTMESDGEWISAFVNGQLTGCARRPSAATTSLSVGVDLLSPGGGSTPAANVLVSAVLVEALQPFLM